MEQSNQSVVASDLEGTITAAETWRGIRDYLKANGRGHLYRRYFLRHLPQVLLYSLGGIKNETQFREQWVLGILQLCRGMTRSEFQTMAGWLVEEHLWPTRREAVAQELRDHKANGRQVVIISGMFEPILEEVARKLEVQSIGTPLAFDGDIFTGQIVSTFNVGERKVAQLETFLNGRTLAAAYGDTVGDIPMLTMSQEAVAVSPDSGLRQTAVERGWRILG